MGRHLSGRCRNTEEPGTVSVEQGKKHVDFLEFIHDGVDQINTDKPVWELEILPPIDITKIMGVVAYLDSLPEVASTEIIPETDSPSIMVFLREPINLIGTLETLPEVAQVKEDGTDIPDDNDKPRKVQIVLNGETVPDEPKKKSK